MQSGAVVGIAALVSNLPKLATCFLLPALALLAGLSGPFVFSRGPKAALQPGREHLPLVSLAAQSRNQTTSRLSPERYTLTPEQRAKAVAYSRATYSIYFLRFVLSAGAFLFLWRARISAWFRNIAQRLSIKLFVQCLVYVPLFVLAFSLIEFPLDYYSGFVLEHRFDLSTETLAAWFTDWLKSLTLTIVLGVFVAWVFYWTVRRSSFRWWVYFWLISNPVVLAYLTVEPYIIEPMFFRFTPLEKTQPVLTARIEQMLHHAGLEIPTSRVFEMDASTKTKGLDAYVSGVGASRRVVIWDNTLRKMTEDETLLVLGHETGHYVLQHVLKMFAIVELLTLLLFYLAFVTLDKIVSRVGPRTGVSSVGDLASLPVVLLVLTVLWFLASPMVNAFSRHFEAQADQFALEVNYGVFPDPNAAEARALQVLGEMDLADPAPNSLVKFWLYTHPPLDDRIRFAVSYKPWEQGRPLEFVHPPTE